MKKEPRARKGDVKSALLSPNTFKLKYSAMLRAASLEDLRLVASWISSARDCELWAGWRVQFPINLETLPKEISFEATNSFSLFSDGQLVAFGQLILKSERRGYLGRIIVAPAARREGHGEALTRDILARARTEGCERACLWVDAANSAAIQLYSKLGFREATAPRDEYSSAQSRYMEKFLLDE